MATKPTPQPKNQSKPAEPKPLAEGELAFRLTTPEPQKSDKPGIVFIQPPPPIYVWNLAKERCPAAAADCVMECYGFPAETKTEAHLTVFAALAGVTEAVILKGGRTIEFPKVPEKSRRQLLAHLERHESVRHSIEQLRASAKAVEQVETEHLPRRLVRMGETGLPVAREMEDHADLLTAIAQPGFEPWDAETSRLAGDLKLRWAPVEVA